MERITYDALTGFPIVDMYGRTCHMAWCAWPVMFDDMDSVYLVPKYGDNRLSIGEPAVVYDACPIDAFDAGQECGCICVDQDNRVWQVVNPVFGCHWRTVQNLSCITCHDFEYAQRRLFDTHKFIRSFGGSCVLHSLAVFVAVCSSVTVSSVNSILQRVKYDTRNEMFLSVVSEFFHNRDNYVVVEVAKDNPYIVVMELLRCGYAVSINVPNGTMLQFQDRSVIVSGQHRTCLVPVNDLDYYIIADVNGIGWYSEDTIKELFQFYSDDWEWLVVGVSETNVEVHRVIDWLVEMSDIEDVRRITQGDSVSDVSFFKSRGIDVSVEQVISASWQHMVSYGKWLSAYVADDVV